MMAVVTLSYQKSRVVTDGIICIPNSHQDHTISSLGPLIGQFQHGIRSTRPSHPKLMILSSREHINSVHGPLTGQTRHGYMSNLTRYTFSMGCYMHHHAKLVFIIHNKMLLEHEHECCICLESFSYYSSSMHTSLLHKWEQTTTNNQNITNLSIITYFMMKTQRHLEELIQIHMWNMVGLKKHFKTLMSSPKWVQHVSYV